MRGSLREPLREVMALVDAMRASGLVGFCADAGDGLRSTSYGNVHRAAR